ncbi:MAG: hypothetical protein J1E40_13075 [Oscillospiraceae bacterium]|nr:hypothetical protein [Oscillospiraceae bacterium]
METFKCKMCDAVLNVREGTTIYVCEYCGTRQEISRGGYDEENAESLLKRAFLFLKEGEWGHAKVYCDMVLERDPENGRAYLGKLMADIKVKREAELAEIAMDYRQNDYLKKAMRYGDPQMVDDLKSYYFEAVYKLAVKIMDSAVRERDYNQAADQFRSLGGYKNAAELKRICEELANEKKIETEKKLYEDEINNKINVRRYLICFSILALPIILIFPTVLSLFNDPFFVSRFLLPVMMIATFWGIFVWNYFNWQININYQIFLFFSVGDNFIISYLINYLFYNISVGRALIFMSICSIVFGFIGDRLGKRKVEKRSKK